MCRCGLLAGGQRVGQRRSAAAALGGRQHLCTEHCFDTSCKRLCCATLEVVDELSSDETPQKLDELGIWWITPSERLGVTYNWNLVSLK